MSGIVRLLLLFSTFITTTYSYHCYDKKEFFKGGMKEKFPKKKTSTSGLCGWTFKHPSMRAGMIENSTCTNNITARFSTFELDKSMTKRIIVSCEVEETSTFCYCYFNDCNKYMNLAFAGLFDAYMEPAKPLHLLTESYNETYFMKRRTLICLLELIRQAYIAPYLNTLDLGDFNKSVPVPTLDQNYDALRNYTQRYFEHFMIPHQDKHTLKDDVFIIKNYEYILFTAFIIFTIIWMIMCFICGVFQHRQHRSIFTIFSQEGKTKKKRKHDGDTFMITSKSFTIPSISHRSQTQLYAEQKTQSVSEQSQKKNDTSRHVKKDDKKEKKA